MRTNKQIPFIALILFCVVALNHASCDAASSRPNILLIISEDNGPELGCYGDPYASTPHLDRLATEGVRFQNAYVTHAGCSESRASILTGLYPCQNGQFGLATWGFRMYREDTPNLPRSLKEAGYRTGKIGKLHVNPASAFPYDMEEIPGANFERKNIGDYARFAESFFREDDKPFYLQVSYPDAHKPWLKQVDGLPKKPLEPDDVKSLAYFGIDPPQIREEIANYYNCISRLDSLVGDLLAALQRSGKADNTIIIYLGDHGADFLRGKRTSYEGGVKIPLIMQWPGKTKAGQVLDEMVSTVDFMPTLLAVAQAKPVDNLPGRSLLPLLLGQKTDWRRYLFTEYTTHGGAENFYPQRTVRNDRFKLIENLLPDEVNPGYDFTNNKLDSVPEAVEAAPLEIRAAYERMRRPPRFELYDLQADSFEFCDLTANPEYAAVLAELQGKLAAWRVQTEDPLLNPGNLARLKTEVYGITSKKGSKSYQWQYPDYFFGKKPEAKKSEKKKGRQVQ